MMRRGLLLSVLTVLLVASGSPAVAAPPERTTDPFPFTAPDFENDLVVFVNTSRETFCTDGQIAFERAVREWLDGGMVGPFPDEATDAQPGFVAVPAQFVETPKGVIATAHVTGLHMELWVLDDPGDQVGVGACLDTDDANERFAVGTSTFDGVVTDFFGAFLKPTTIDHTKGRGIVTADDGTRYRYTWFYHQHIPCGENDENDRPGPRCEVANNRLRALR